MSTSRSVNWHPQVGDVVRLKARYHGTSVIATVINVAEQNSSDKLFGWTTFEIQILTDSGELVHITPGCIEQIL